MTRGIDPPGSVSDLARPAEALRDTEPAGIFQSRTQRRGASALLCAQTPKAQVIGEIGRWIGVLGARLREPFLPQAGGMAEPPSNHLVDPGVPGELGVPEPGGDSGDVDARLEQVHSRRVADHVRCDVPSVTGNDPGPLGESPQDMGNA